MQSFSNEISARGKRAVVDFILEVSGRNVPDDPQLGAQQATRGEVVFDQHCRACHKLNGSGATAQDVPLGVDFDIVRPSPERVRHMVVNGDWWMPALRKKLSSQQIKDVTAYVVTVSGGGDPKGSAGAEDPSGAD